MLVWSPSECPSRHTWPSQGSWRVCFMYQRNGSLFLCSSPQKCLTRLGWSVSIAISSLDLNKISLFRKSIVLVLFFFLPWYKIRKTWCSFCGSGRQADFIIPLCRLCSGWGQTGQLCLPPTWRWCCTWGSRRPPGRCCSRGRSSLCTGF